MKTQTRDLKKCISKRFVENFKMVMAGVVMFIALVGLLFACISIFDNKVAAILFIYYLLIIFAFTVIAIVNRKLKRGFINFIKRFLLMNIMFPLIFILLIINLVCVVGFPIMLAAVCGLIYIVWFNGESFAIMCLVMLISGILSLAFTMALDDCLKMTKWLTKVSNSVADLIILEDDSSL